MIPKSIDEITKLDIDALIQNQVREARTIEYKLILPGNSDEEKREFLADISSFANAGGGDLLYGIEESDGVPKNAVGLKDCKVDVEINRLECIIRYGINPRIPGVSIHPIEGFPQGPVLLVRVPKSWVSPHMVTFKNLSKFYTRNSAGKHQMDVTEIRSAFLLSEALPERIKRFRDERLGRIIAGETPVLLQEGAKLVLHILPIVSFTSKLSLNISALQEHAPGLHTIGISGGCEQMYNLDGFLTYFPYSGALSPSYCQLFRTGQIESVNAEMVYEQDGRRLIPIIDYEKNVIWAIMNYLRVLKKLEVPAPLFIFIAMLGVLGIQMPRLGIQYHHFNRPIDRDTLILPDILIEEYPNLSESDEKSNFQEIAKLLRPVFDAVWNACGFPRSFNYDNQGNWNPRY